MLTLNKLKYLLGGIVVFYSAYSNAQNDPMLPSLEAKLSATDAMLEADYKIDKPDTDGYVLENENGEYIVVDNLDDPKCVFYGNYAVGEAKVYAINAIEQLNLNCEE